MKKIKEESVSVTVDVAPLTEVEVLNFEDLICGVKECLPVEVEVPVEAVEVEEEGLNQIETAYDEEEFTRGVKKGSYLAGIASALIPLGFSEERIIEVILSERTIDHNIEMIKLKLEHPALSDYEALVDEEMR